MSDIQRFIDAQARIYQSALAELKSGHKRGHWMWFVFPQLRGLGSSAMAHAYGIASLDEARAYLQHPLLGTRLRDCTQAVNALQGRTAGEIFGYPDDMKFRSCLTLFESAGMNPEVFSLALDRYYDGERDALTRRLLVQRP